MKAIAYFFHKFRYEQRNKKIVYLARGTDDICEQEIMTLDEQVRGSVCTWGVGPLVGELGAVLVVVPADHVPHPHTGNHLFLTLLPSIHRQQLIYIYIYFFINLRTVHPLVEKDVGSILRSSARENRI